MSQCLDGTIKNLFRVLHRNGYKMVIFHQKLRLIITFLKIAINPKCLMWLVGNRKAFKMIPSIHGSNPGPKRRCAKIPFFQDGQTFSQMSESCFSAI